MTPHCQKCSSPLNFILYCEDCQLLQKWNSTTDYYKILSIPRSLLINESEINDKIDELITFVHPDFYRDTTPEQEQLSEEYSTLLNQIKTVFESPFLRSKYYLTSLKGAPINLDQFKLPQDFLMEVFEIQEDLEEETITLETQTKALVILENIDEELISSFDIFAKKDSETNFYNACLALNKFKFALNIREKLN